MIVWIRDDDGVVGFRPLFDRIEADHQSLGRFEFRVHVWRLLHWNNQVVFQLLVAAFSVIVLEVLVDGIAGRMAIYWTGQAHDTDCVVQMTFP